MKKFKNVCEPSRVFLQGRPHVHLPVNLKAIIANTEDIPGDIVASEEPGYEDLFPRDHEPLYHCLVCACWGMTIGRVHKIVEMCKYKYVDCGTSVGILAANSIGSSLIQATLDSIHRTGSGDSDTTNAVRAVESVLHNSQGDLPIFQLRVDDVVQALEHFENITIGDVVWNVQGVTTYEPFVKHFKRSFPKVFREFESTPGGTLRMEVCPHMDRKIFFKALSHVKYIHDFGANIVYIRARDPYRVLKRTVCGFKHARRVLLRGNICHIQAKCTLKNFIRHAVGIGIDQSISCDSPQQVYEYLGIEAARHVIIQRLIDILGNSVHRKHFELIADVMTHTGNIVSMNRHGYLKNNSSYFAKASFEASSNTIMEAAWIQREETVQGASERIALGQTVQSGTAICDLLLDEASLVNATVDDDRDCHDGGRGHVELNLPLDPPQGFPAFIPPIPIEETLSPTPYEQMHSTSPGYVDSPMCEDEEIYNPHEQDSPAYY